MTQGQVILRLGNGIEMILDSAGSDGSGYTVMKTSQNGQCTLSSNLKSRFVDEAGDSLSVMKDNAVCDVIEAIVLAHYATGVNVLTFSYIEGLNTAIEAIANNL